MVAVAAMGMVGCATVVADKQGQVADSVTPVLSEAFFVSTDGVRLPLRTWGHTHAPAVVVAVHGLNDHAGAFAQAAEGWADRGIRTYAYDQRGFGGAPGDGWQGHAVMAEDLAVLLRLVRERHATARLFVVGESIGAAIATLALARGDRPQVDGVILAAPALRPKTTTPVYQRVLGWVAANALPGMTIPRDPRRSHATDNTAVLAEMAEDPKIPKGVRLDTFMGLGQTMDAAIRASLHLDVPVLILRGLKDPVITPGRVDVLATYLEGAAVPVTMVSYAEGYHLLFRDRQAERVIADVARWIHGQNPVAVPQIAEVTED